VISGKIGVRLTRAKEEVDRTRCDEEHFPASLALSEKVFALLQIDWGAHLLKEDLNGGRLLADGCERAPQLLARLLRC